MKTTPIGPRVCVYLGLMMLTALSVPAAADPMSCNLSGYRATPGLSATSGDHTLTVSWDGDRNQQLRLRFGILGGTPIIQELALRRNGGTWNVLAANVTPEVRVVSGLRRISNQQLTPLRNLGVELTNDIIDKYRWEPFWDAPLEVDVPGGRGGNPPPAAGVANSPGLPRKPEEIRRGAGALPRDGMRSEDERREARSVVPRRAGWCLQRLAAVLHLQGDESDPAGSGGDDERAVGRVQVRRGPAWNYRVRCTRRVA